MKPLVHNSKARRYWSLLLVLWLACHTAGWAQPVNVETRVAGYYMNDSDGAGRNETRMFIWMGFQNMTQYVQGPIGNKPGCCTNGVIMGPLDNCEGENNNGRGFVHYLPNAASLVAAVPSLTTCPGTYQWYHQWAPINYHAATTRVENANVNDLNMDIQSWEDDTNEFGCGSNCTMDNCGRPRNSDDCQTNRTRRINASFRNDPQCQWNTYHHCGARNGCNIAAIIEARWELSGLTGTFAQGATTVQQGCTVNFTHTGSTGIPRYWMGAVPSVGSTSLVSGWNECSDCYDGQTNFSHTFNTPGVYLIRTHNRSACWSVWNWGDFKDLWVTVVPQPTSPTITANPAAASVCPGTNVSATIAGGAGGISPVNVAEYRTNNGFGWTPWMAYTPSTLIATTGLTGVEIRTYRTSASACPPNSSTPNVYSWTVSPVPTAGVIVGPVNICNGAGGITYSIPAIVGASSYNWTLLNASSVDVTGSVTITNATTNSPTIDFNALTAGSYTLRVTPIGAGPTFCTGIPSDLVLNISSTASLAGNLATWLGGQNANDWNTPTNWNIVPGVNCVPTCANPTLVVNAGVNSPVLSGNASVSGLVLQGVALAPTTLNLGPSATLTVCSGDLERATGFVTINASPTSRIRFVGTAVPQGLYGMFTSAQNSRLGIVEVANGSDVEFSQTVMLHDLIIEDAGSSVTTNNNNLWVGGMLEIESGASYIPGSNTTYFDGSAPGFYNDLSGSVVLHNVVTAKAGNNVTLNSNMTLGVTGVLTLNTGLINANGFTMKVQNPSPTAAIQNASANSYLYNGFLQRSIQGSGLGQYTFPVGTSADYHPMSIDWAYATNPITHSAVRVQMIPGAPPSDNYSAINTPGIDGCSYGAYTQSLNHGYWQVVGVGSGSSGHYNMTLGYGGGATNEPVPGTAITVVSRPGPGAWTLDGLCDNSSTLALVRRTRMTAFSDKAIAITDMPFPVELAHLRATPFENRAIAVEWTTLGERNNMGFAIERSLEPLAGFSEIGWRPGAINSTEALAYRLLDEAVEPNIRYYYRLRQVDLDGAVNYSNTVEAQIDPNQSASLHLAVRPNPVRHSGQLLVDYDAPAGQVLDFRLVDMMGRIVWQTQQEAQPGGHTLQLSTSEMSTGVYHIIVQSELEQQIRKLVITQ